MPISQHFLDTEAVLAPEIQPIGKADFSETPKTIFITGATGFVAAFVLKELLEQTEAQIYALARAKDSASAMNRIRENLRGYDLWHDWYEHRIIAVAGDLKAPRFGLSDTDFDFLANTVDAIYHLASKLSYIAPYHYLKAANVDGTQETLRLATQGKPKPYHFVSSLGILMGYQDPTGGHEDDPLDAAKCPEVGYFQTKYVAEAVVRLARERGIPVSIYRIGLIVGDSQTGQSNADDFVTRILLGCIQAGYGPGIHNAMDMTPVDYIAQTIVYLSQQTHAEGQVFHLLNPEPVTWGNIMDAVSELGYAVTKLPYRQWVDAIEQYENPETNPLHPLLPFFQLEFAGRMLGVSETAYNALGRTQTLNALSRSGIECARVDNTLVSTYLLKLIEAGHLEPLLVRV